MKHGLRVRLGAALRPLTAALLLAAPGAPLAAARLEAFAVDPPYVGKNTPAASAGAVIRGIGFTSATTVTFDGVQASVTFVDSRTLRVQVPTSSVGKISRIVVSDGAASDEIYPFVYTDLIFYVKPTGSDTANGTSPAAAFRTINKALNSTSAVTTNVVRVAAGTYNESSLAIFGGDVLEGGWDVNFTQRDPDQFVTVVDAGRGGFAIRSGGLDSVQVLDGITIRNGVREGLGGGAVVISGDNTVITNSVLVGNTSSSRGGGIYATFNTSYGGTPIISNNVLLGNRSFSSPGGAIGIYPIYTHGRLIDVAVSDNYILGNRSFTNRGGGVGVTSSAMYAYNVMSLQLVGNVIGGNLAAVGGGAAIVAAGSPDRFDLLLDNDLFFGNTASGEGGGLFIGGVGHIAGQVTGSTFASNAGGLDGGGGIRFTPSVTYEPTFEARNLISWGNVNGNLAGAQLATFSDIGGGSPGTGNISQDPRFVAGPMGRFYLAQDGGTMSPAVDSGGGMASDFSMENQTTDTGLAPDSGLVDMGFHYPVDVGPSPDPIALTRIDPQEGDLGGADWVLLRGRGFDPGATVTFDGAPAADTIYVSPRRILAQPAPHAMEAVDVVVTNPDLTSATQAGAYRYVDNLPPSWPTTVGLQQAASKVDCVRSVVLTWNPAVDAVTPPVSYTIHRELCIPTSNDFRNPCTNTAYAPSATNRVTTTGETFYVDTAFGSGGADPKYIYMVRAADAASPTPNNEFNYSKRIVVVGRVTGDTTPPANVGILEVPSVNLLDWPGAPGAVSYRVYRQSNASDYASPAGLTPLITLTTSNNDLDGNGVTDTQFVDTASPAAGGAFFYKVTALDPCNNETRDELLP